ncbi:BMC domain-containing protein, partial [Myxococcota bacterium]|nr:BMC domain-containing protein [Myxococcota bacterium]
MNTPVATKILRPKILSMRKIDAIHPELAAQYGLDPERHFSAGFITCDQDDSLYVALDQATKFAEIDVVYAKSFYAGADHASGPL